MDFIPGPLLLATLLAVVVGTLLVWKYLLPSNKQESSGGDSLIAKDNSITIQKVYMEAIRVSLIYTRVRSIDAVFNLYITILRTFQMDKISHQRQTLDFGQLDVILF